MYFLERLSSIMGKQYLFRQDNGLYYNRMENEYMTKEEAQDWIFTELNELVNGYDWGLNEN